MKIVSWNVDCGNNDLKRVENLIQQTNPDILCLQEVSAVLRDHLESRCIKNHYPHITSAIDHYASGLFGISQQMTSHLMILSKIKFEGVPIRYQHKRATSRILLAWIRGWQECIEYHGINIAVGEHRWRVLNLHLPCADTFRNKLKCFRSAVVRHANTDGPTIVCGDLNITDTPETKHLPDYALRVFFPDFAPPIRERLQRRAQRNFSRMVRKLKLCDVFQNDVTHPTTGLSLDRILVPHHLVNILEPTVSPDTFGSDHYPRTVRFDLHI
jgi:exonuclease III